MQRAAPDLPPTSCDVGILLGLFLGLRSCWPLDGLDPEHLGLRGLRGGHCGWNCAGLWPTFVDKPTGPEGLQHHREGMHVYHLHLRLSLQSLGVFQFLCLPAFLHSLGCEFEIHHGYFALHLLALRRQWRRSHRRLGWGLGSRKVGCWVCWGKMGEGIQLTPRLKHPTMGFSKHRRFSYKRVSAVDGDFQKENWSIWCQTAHHFWLSQVSEGFQALQGKKKPSQKECQWPC